jgi:hypothetical protein
MINLGIQSSCDEALYQVCLQNNPWSTLEYRAPVMKYCIRYVHNIIHDQPWNTELLWWSTVEDTNTKTLLEWKSHEHRRNDILINSHGCWPVQLNMCTFIPGQLFYLNYIVDYFVDIPDTVLHHRSSVFQGWSWIMLYDQPWNTELLWWSTVSGMSIT